MQRVWGGRHAHHRAKRRHARQARAPEDRGRPGRAAVRADRVGHGIQVRRCLILSGTGASTGASRSASSRCSRCCCSSQGLLFLWLTDRIVGTSPRTPAQLAGSVAEDVGAELEQHPGHRRSRPSCADRFSHILSAVPRRAARRPARVEPAERAAARVRPIGPGTAPRRYVGGGRFGDAGLPPRGGGAGGSEAIPDGWSAGAASSNRGWHDGAGMPRAFPARVRRTRSRSWWRFGDEAARGSQSNTPRSCRRRRWVSSRCRRIRRRCLVALRELGPTLTLVRARAARRRRDADGALRLPPAHKRLRTLEQAARALGEGRTDVRATETGGDEVSSLARTFNRMAADLDSRAAALAQSDRARRQLLADVSHELMTPLSAIRGYVETLGMPELPLDQDTRRAISTSSTRRRTSSKRSSATCSTSRASKGAASGCDAEPVSVADLFARVADRHAPALRERGITLELDIAPDTPQILGDAGRLEQALQNVAANAIRHTPAGGRVHPRGGARRQRRPHHRPGHGSRASRRSTCRTSSIGSTRWTPRAPAPPCRRAAASACRSSARSSRRHGGTVTAANAPRAGHFSTCAYQSLITDP